MYMKTSNTHLYSHNYDLEQLQAQFERFATLCMVLVTGAHEKIFELSPQGVLLLFLLLVRL